jgi:hypothetical protein
VPAAGWSPPEPGPGATGSAAAPGAPYRGEGSGTPSHMTVSQPLLEPSSLRPPTHPLDGLDLHLPDSGLYGGGVSCEGGELVE